MTYPEGLQVIDGQRIAIEMEQGILEHAAVPVTGKRVC